MGSIIRFTGTVFYSLLCVNSRLVSNGLKYVYTVISVIDNSLPGNTKKYGIAPFVDGKSAISPFVGGTLVFFSIHTHVHSRFSLNELNVERIQRDWRRGCAHEFNGMGPFFETFFESAVIMPRV